MKIFSWVLFACILLFFGAIYFLASFSLFDESQKIKLFDLSYKTQSYIIVSVNGNATTNSSVQLFEIDNGGNEIQHSFLNTRPYYTKGYQNRLNDSIFQCIFIVGTGRKDTVLLNMKTKKMNFHSE
ncbi:hypothetical protein [Bernardetia sp.]|uniref:hypothetical protein n=1 Tax=Bernardetia sp. TaxID=1937974 RepID=UPI0025B80C4A|nr:hypothetical protein [Bernardetia sp.]